MYYWDFVNFKNVPSLVREAAEDIYLLSRNEWDYMDTKATEKMKQIFEKPEELLQQVMSMKAMIGDKEIENAEEPEELLRRVENKKRIIKNIVKEKMWSPVDKIGPEIDVEAAREVMESKEFKENTENIISLSMFVFQMALYRFCKVDFPKVSRDLNTANLEEVMEDWEELFWTTKWKDYNIYSDNRYIDLDYKDLDYEDLFSKRKRMRDLYYACFTEEGIGKGFWCGFQDGYDKSVECLQRVLEDEETVRAVKEMQQSMFSYSNSKEENGLKEIRNMKHLLDIMERNIKGELTLQDKAELSGNAHDWSTDIESLIHMIKDLPK